MNKLGLFSILFWWASTSAQVVAIPEAVVSEKLLQCSFRESGSVSFGYRSVYFFSGEITDAGSDGSHFYEVNDPAQVSIDDTASTNFPGRHVTDATAQINNHPWGEQLLLDITSTDTSGAGAFRIFVFREISRTPTSNFPAYKIDSLTGNGLAGVCNSVDPRLQT